MNNFSRRVSVLEEGLEIKGKPYIIWAMTDDCMPMTGVQIEAAIEQDKTDGAPANLTFMPVSWLVPQG